MKHTSLFATFLFAACSGGGGSTSDTSAPPETGSTPISRTNTAPALSIALSNTSVFERQSISIDASDSNDADGDTLVYDLKLEPTAYAELGSASNGPVWTINTNDVDADTVIAATVSVSDDTDTVSQAVEFTITNYDRTPLKATWADISDTYEITANGSAKFSENRFYDGFKFTHLLRTNEANELEAVEFEFFNSKFDPPNVISLGLPGDSEASLLAHKIQFGSERAGFAVVSPGAETAKVIKRESRSAGSVGGRLTLPGLCSASWKYIVLTSEITERVSLFVGTDNGLWGWLNDGRAVNNRDVSGSFSASTIWNPSGNFCHPGEQGLYYNTGKRELDVWETGITDHPDLPMPMAVNAPLGLDVVDVRIGKGENHEPFIVLLFAGDTHDAPHQLSILYETLSGQIEQLDYALPAGIPTDLEVHSIDTNFIDMARGTTGNRDADIVIAVPETPYVYVIETQYSETEGISFGPLEFFEAGFGVRDVAIIVTDGTNQFSLLTTDGYTLNLHKSALEFSRF